VPREVDVSEMWELRICSVRAIPGSAAPLGGGLSRFRKGRGGFRQRRCYWLPLAQIHLTRRVFEATLRRTAASSLPAG